MWRWSVREVLLYSVRVNMLSRTMGNNLFSSTQGAQPRPSNAKTKQVYHTSTGTTLLSLGRLSFYLKSLSATWKTRYNSFGHSVPYHCVFSAAEDPFQQYFDHLQAYQNSFLYIYSYYTLHLFRELAKVVYQEVYQPVTVCTHSNFIVLSHQKSRFPTQSFNHITISPRPNIERQAIQQHVLYFIDLNLQEFELLTIRRGKLGLLPIRPPRPVQQPKYAQGR